MSSRYTLRHFVDLMPSISLIMEESLYSNSTRRRMRGPEGDDDVGIVQQEHLALKEIAKR